MLGWFRVSGKDRTYREGSLEKEVLKLKKGGHSNVNGSHLDLGERGRSLQSTVKEFRHLLEKGSLFSETGDNTWERIVKFTHIKKVENFHT